MENATRALLIAGTVLISIIMVSTAVYLYAQFSTRTHEYRVVMSAVELDKFNSNFSVYVGRENITAQEIVSVVNLAKEYGNQVEIYLSTSKLDFSVLGAQEDFIKDNQDKIFKCVLSTVEANPNPKYDSNGKIIRLRFTVASS